MFFSVAHRVIGWFFIAEEWLRCLQRSVLSSSWGFHDLKMFGEKAHNLKRCGTFFGMKVMVSSASGCWENRGLKTRWWFQIFFMFISIWGRFPIWLIFFKWVETTNQRSFWRFGVKLSPKVNMSPWFSGVTRDPFEFRDLRGKSQPQIIPGMNSILFLFQHMMFLDLFVWWVIFNGLYHGKSPLNHHLGEYVWICSTNEPLVDTWRNSIQYLPWRIFLANGFSNSTTN